MLSLDNMHNKMVILTKNTFLNQSSQENISWSLESELEEEKIAPFNIPMVEYLFLCVSQSYVRDFQYNFTALYTNINERWSESELFKILTISI